MKIEKIDYNEYDELYEIEEIIKMILEEKNHETSKIIFKEKEDQIKYILTMKTLINMKYMYTKQYNQINQTLEKLYKKINKTNDLNEINKLIIDNNLIINEICNDYYFPRNYIYKKYCDEIILEEGKKVIKDNPFYLNNHLKAFNKTKLTKEEKIINNVIEYYLLTNKSEYKIEQIDAKIEITKGLLQTNLGEEYNDHILYMISNIYQEIIKNSTHPFYSDIKTIVENEDIKTKDIITHFNQNSNFSNTVVKYFLQYNKDIDENRLHELENYPSYEKTKRIYQKDDKKKGISK